MMSFCSKCGKEITDGSQFCSGCGQAIGGQTTQQQTQQQYQQTYQPIYPQQVCQQPINLLQQLAGKIKTEAVVWIAVASLQVIIGIWNFVVGIGINSSYYSDGEGTTNIIMGMILLAVATVNFITSSKDFKYSRDIFSNPTGIVTKFTPIGGYIANLIYNFLFGGIVGVVGSIFGFVTRSFVVNNQQAFSAIEQDFMNNNTQQTQN